MTLLIEKLCPHTGSMVFISCLDVEGGIRLKDHVQHTTASTTLSGLSGRRYHSHMTMKMLFLTLVVSVIKI